MAIHYVDADHGDDVANGGTSPTDAWQTLSGLWGKSIARGDTIYFRRCDNTYLNDTADDFLNLSGSVAPYTFTSCIGDDGSYGITEWEVAGDSTTVVWERNTSFIARLNATADYGTLIKNIRFKSGTYGFRVRSGMLVFDNCIFKGRDSADDINMTNYGFYVEHDNGPLIFNDCTFSGFTASYPPIYLIYSGMPIHFNRCFIDVDGYLIKYAGASNDVFITDSTVITKWSLINYHTDYGAVNYNIHLKNCELSSGYPNPSPTTFDTKDYYAFPVHWGRSILPDNWLCPIDVERYPCIWAEDINGVPGPFGRAGAGWAIMYDSTSPDQREGGGGSMVTTRLHTQILNESNTFPCPLSDSTTRLLIAKWDFELPEADGATEYKASIWAKAGPDWGSAETLNGPENFYLDIEYLSGPDGESLCKTTRVQSTSEITEDDTWTEISCTFTPSRSGSAKAKVYLSDFYSDDDYLYIDNYLDVIENV